MRQRVVLFVIVTLVFLGGGVLIYAERTGLISIFADIPNVPGTIRVTDSIDLQKGLEAGENVELVDGVIRLQPGATAGRCQYDVGSPQIKEFFRFQAVKTEDFPPNTGIKLRFASSLDGVAFGPLSAPITLSPAATSPDTIDLTQVLPENVHFLRITCELVGTPEASPIFAGFTLDYEALNIPSSATGPLNFVAEPLKGQAPLTVRFSRSTGNDSCTWNFGDGQTAATGEPTVSHTYNRVGTFAAVLRCGSQEGRRTITVTSEPFAAVAARTIQQQYAPGAPIELRIRNEGPAEVSLGQESLAVSAPLAGETIRSTISFPNQTLRPGQETVYTWDQRTDAGAPAEPGIYQLSLTYQVADAPTTYHTLVSISAEARNRLGFSVDPVQGQAPFQAELTAAPSSAGMLDFGDGTVSRIPPGSQRLRHTYADPNTYRVSLHAASQVATEVLLVTSGEVTADLPSIPILINGYLAGTSEATATGNLAGQPDALIATGFLDVATNALAVLWLGATVLIFTYRPKTHRS